MAPRERLFEVNEGVVEVAGESVDDIERQGRCAEMHPLIGGLIGSQAVEFDEPSMDTPESLRELEAAQRAVAFVEAWYSPPELTPLQKALGPLNHHRHSVDRINNQFATKIIPCLTHPDRKEALARFRGIIPNTVDEEMVLLTNDQQFDALHEQLAEYLDNIGDELDLSVQQNVEQIKMADRMQFNGRVTRSLERMINKGLPVTIDPSGADLVREAHQMAGEGILPITEYVKNRKVLGVSGFMGSKVSLAVHDYMDHLWTFAMLDRTGILDRYSKMFDSIGNPEATDIYKREGEIVASIAFGVRYFQTMPSAFGPLMRSSQIGEQFDKLFVEGQLEQRHMPAYQNLKKMRKGSIDWQSLGFSFSNYITELDQQRRKYGRIKQRDPRTKQLIGELDPLSPDFMCFFIDAHQELMNPQHKHRDDLFRVHILVEEYLASFAKGEIKEDEPLTIKPCDLRNLDFNKTTLPPQRIAWMRNNHGFTATRDAII